jgi:hypothetical protein
MGCFSFSCGANRLEKEEENRRRETLEHIPSTHTRGIRHGRYLSRRTKLVGDIATDNEKRTINERLLAALCEIESPNIENRERKRSTTAVFTLPSNHVVSESTGTDLTRGKSTLFLVRLSMQNFLECSVSTMYRIVPILRPIQARRDARKEISIARTTLKLDRQQPNTSSVAIFNYRQQVLLIVPAYNIITLEHWGQCSATSRSGVLSLLASPGHRPR